jgi:NAD(P)-dependent dehydrogenase (short-subunit alcohol dehydrogenase family)
MFLHMLHGQRSLITGASRGLGRALCEEFARQGARIAFIYSSDDSGAEETGRRLAALGVEFLPLKASVTDAGGLDAAVDRIVAEWNGLDILVNNAGLTQVLPLALMDEADWDHVLDINLRGVYVTTRAVLRTMVRQKSGVILNMGSLAGGRRIAAPVHYSASKSGIRGFTAALSKELVRYNIRVLCLEPGLLDEGVAGQIPESNVAEYVEHVALKRVGRLDEVARFAGVLVSPRNSYMNGVSVAIDGGF